MIHFGNNALLPGVWIATATSLPLGNIDIDQAVVSTIAARIAAAKVTLVRMTPTSRSVSRRISFGAYGGGKSVNRLTQTSRRAGENTDEISTPHVTLPFETRDDATHGNACRRLRGRTARTLIKINSLTIDQRK